MQGPNKWCVAFLVTMGMFIAFLDTTIVDITLPKMMSTLEADMYDAQWIIIAYLMGAAVAMTFVGWIAGLLGHRDTYLWGLMLFVAMSALCGAASSLEAMLASRFLQGVGEGMLIPVGWLLLSDAFPPQERGLAMGIYGLGAAFAPAIGPSLGGLITEHLTWRWIFYVNVPIGLLDAMLVIWLIQNRKSSPQAPLDLVGVILLSVALSSLVVFVSKGQEKEWLQSDFILQMVVVFCLCFAGFIFWELLAPRPLIPRSVFIQKEVSLALLALGLNSMVAYGVYLLLPVFLQRLKGFTTLDSGLIMLPGSMASALATLLGGALADRLRPKTVAIAFLLAGAWATWVFRTGYLDPRSAIIWDNLLWGFAISGAFAPLSYLVFASLKEEDFAHGSMIINVTRLVAGSIGTAVSTNILTSRQNAFYDAISSRIEWGSYAGKELLGYLGSWLASPDPGAYFDPNATQVALEMARRLIQAVAGAEAFMATYKHLALLMLLAVAAVVLARNLKVQGMAPGH
ncbi:MAG: DHA2 family efflux MFS transporter permease subunit [bacterium]